MMVARILTTDSINNDVSKSPAFIIETKSVLRIINISLKLVQ